MAKVINRGWAKPDAPIYKSGAVVGGKRFGPSSKSGDSAPKSSKQASPRASSTQRHPSRPSLDAASPFPMLSAAKLIQLQNDSSSDFQILQIRKRRSQSSPKK
mgnify:CR=1 FL=1